MRDDIELLGECEDGWLNDKVYVRNLVGGSACGRWWDVGVRLLWVINTEDGAINVGG